jgi:hypothetical protein
MAAHFEGRHWIREFNAWRKSPDLDLDLDLDLAPAGAGQERNRFVQSADTHGSTHPEPFPMRDAQHLETCAAVIEESHAKS